MDKSSAMRMLQSELRDKRAAATVWFNAWHHQKEDRLLAYLLEAIQKQVAPSWLSAVGIGFRFNLLRVRMFASVGRFLTILFAIIALVLHSSIAGLLSRKIEPLTGAAGSHVISLAAVLSIGIGVLMNQLRAFSADPQKLLESATKSAWRFLRDLFVFPSLQGETDVRHEFEKNIREVTDALRPQRLVIFLDDLDRCRPEQVVQILEAINFLSSAAPCFIILGADYSKVETLVGMQFEALAVQEKQNAGAESPDPVKTRLDYARSYMKKVVNLRLNLPRPDQSGWKRLLAQPAERFSDTAIQWQRAVAAAVLVLCLSAVVAQSMGWRPSALGAKSDAVGPLSDRETAPVAAITPGPIPASNEPVDPSAKPQETPGNCRSQATARTVTASALCGATA
jgi:hypothetical protein